MSHLPVRSRSGGVQRSHLRRYGSGRVVRVNPGVKKKVVSRVVNKKSSRGTGAKGVSGRVTGSFGVTPSPRVRWFDVLKRDDGSNYPVGYRMDWDKFDNSKYLVRIYEELDLFPNRNEDEFVEYAKELLIEKVDELRDTNMTLKEFEKDVLPEVVRECNAELDGDISEPMAWVDYGGDYFNEGERGEISKYSEFNVDDIDIKWKSSGVYNGYYEVDLPKDSMWAVFHSDNALSMSGDSQNLAKFNDILTSELSARGIKWARVSCISSNIFSVGIDYLVEKDRYDEAVEIASKLAKVYRREEDYNREVNPLYGSVSDNKKSGKSRKEIEDLLKDVASDDAKSMLKSVLDEVDGDE